MPEEQLSYDVPDECIRSSLRRGLHNALAREALCRVVVPRDERPPVTSSHRERGDDLASRRRTWLVYHIT